MTAACPWVLTITCPDRVGIVAAVSGFLAERDCFITESSHFGDIATGRFFMRTVFTAPAQDIEADFRAIAANFDMRWRLRPLAERVRAVLLVSRIDHCLNDLLYRTRTGALNMDIAAVVSNHTDLAGLVEWHHIPFHHLPVTAASRTAVEARLADLIEAEGVELIVLARYMQILSPEFCARYSGRILNIHHSFLPSFKGGRPYHQAHERGVKLIGATAHFVTADLDDGPIIEQETGRVDHTATPGELVSIGRDLENIVLARAVRFYLERRILLNGVKTVVFR